MFDSKSDKKAPPTVFFQFNFFFSKRDSPIRINLGWTRGLSLALPGDPLSDMSVDDALAEDEGNNHVIILALLFYCNNESLVWSCSVSVAKCNSQFVQNEATPKG